MRRSDWSEFCYSSISPQKTASVDDQFGLGFSLGFGVGSDR